MSSRAAAAAAVVLLTLLMGVSTAAAAAMDAWELVHPKGLDAADAAHRLAVARDLEDRVGLLAAVVPPLAPNRAERVEREQARIAALGDEASAGRRSRLYLSRDYQHATLLRILEDITDALACITAGAEDVRREMACWAAASTQFLDQETISVALAVLRRSRLIPRDEDMPVAAMDPVVWYAEYGRGIVTYILTPYLEGAVEAP